MQIISDKAFCPCALHNGVCVAAWKYEYNASTFVYTLVVTQY